MTITAAGTAVLAAVALAATPLVRLSTDPYTNPSSQHQTEVEPDTFAFGSTMVATFQVGRFFDGGASNVGFATSIDSGATWTSGFLPGTTTFATPPGPYGRLSDPAVAFDAKHDVWLISTLALSAGGTPRAVLSSRSTDGGLSWANPVVVATGSIPDKNWVVCDNTPASKFYGNCYVEWDDNGIGNRIKMNTSTDGGLTWGPSRETADHATGIGGQPLVRPNGTVVVPVANANIAKLMYFTSANGGASWGAPMKITTISDHEVASNLRTEPLPSAEIDKQGRVFVAWQDCRFRSGCDANDIVFAKINPSGGVSAVKRIPIDSTSSGIDHFTPGLAVDRTTKGTQTHLALTYYYYPVSDCGSSCELRIGFVSSRDAGKTWTAPVDIAGPMHPTWLADTSQGRMYGDYISTSYVGGTARPGIIVANAPTGGVFDEAAYTTASGLFRATPAVASVDESPVPDAASDHPAPAGPVTAN
ncbi:MAG TPA: sialidase family protein [Gaiellaceae bacterium]|nr:sialidase family protein [Gaiellaceae bacterium]